jgi:large subunit ribosomal protein L3
MAGHLGNERITTQNLRVVRVDSALNLIFLKGCVPGVDNAHVMVKDSKKIMHNLAKAAHARGRTDRILPKGVVDLPFPAGTAEMAKVLPPVIEATSPRIKSPFTPEE